MEEVLDLIVSFAKQKKANQGRFTEEENERNRIRGRRDGQKVLLGVRR